MVFWNGPTDGITDCTPYFDTLVNNMLAPAGFDNPPMSGVVKGWYKNIFDATVYINGAKTSQISNNAHWSSNADRIIEFPYGTFLFKSPVLSSGSLPSICIRGQGKFLTKLVKQFNGGTFFQSSGNLGNGVIIERLSILADNRYTTGNCIWLVGTGTFQPDNFQLIDLYIGPFGTPPILGTTSWENGILIDGINRTSPQGVRFGIIDFCDLNDCKNPIWIRNGYGIVMRGGTISPSSANMGSIFITGGTSQLTKSFNLHFQDVIINNGALAISASSYCTWIGGSITGLSTDASDHWRIDTLNFGSVFNNLVDSRVDLIPVP